MQNLEAYQYELPKELIAQAPREPRGSSRLFVYDTHADDLAFDTFNNIGKHLPAGALLVRNSTMVVPARVRVLRPTGGKVELLLLMNEHGGGTRIGAISNRRLAIGEIVTFSSGETMRVAAQRENIFEFELCFEPRLLVEILAKIGVTPTPPYINYPGHEAQLRSAYQSVFARHPASVAAPTASLHFSAELFDLLRAQGFLVAELALHVGLGTFAPVKADQLAQGKLHGEYFDLPSESSQMIARAKAQAIPVVAIGTTVVRALESAAPHILGGAACSGKTELFIRPPFQFQITDALITNFHVPGSSLICLVDALLRDKKAKRNVLDLYGIAIAERFRFFSFGDAMLIR